MERVLAALQEILDGATPDSLEGQHLEFKEDPARTRKPAGNPEARAVEVLVDAAICFANATGPSYIVFGVRDKASGVEAFTGTDWDPARLRTRIYSRTSPRLTTEVEPLEWAGKRLLVIRIPQQLEVYTRTDGAATARHQSSCIPLTDVGRQQLRMERMNPDYTNTASNCRVDDLLPAALDEGIRLFNSRTGREPVATGGDLLRALGLMQDDGKVKVAAELLFGGRMEQHLSLVHLWRPVPGAEPQRNDISGPLVFALQRALARIAATSNAEMYWTELPTGQEMGIRDFPTQAVEEVLANAFIHRDWLLQQPITVEQSPYTLAVQSPGGLPWGVEYRRLLTANSVPRNHALMHAMRSLGLAEQTSRGFDRMFAAMLRTGRDTPEIICDDASVRVVFAAGGANLGFVKFLADLREEFGTEVADNLNTLLLVYNFQTASALTVTAVSELLQLETIETRETMRWLESRGVVRSGAEDVPTWSPSPAVRKMMERYVSVAPAVENLEDWILSRMSGGSVTNREIVQETKSHSKSVTEVLRRLMLAGHIEKDPTGPQRGTGVRWMLVRRG